MEEPATIQRARIAVLNVNPGHVATDFFLSMLGLFDADVEKGWNCFTGIFARRSTPNVAKTRNDLVAAFLDEDQGEWALMIDSDMVFPADAHIRLLSAAQQVETKIIGGLCVIDHAYGPLPTLYSRRTADERVVIQQLDYPEDTLVQVAATGAAFLMVHRDVFQAIRDAAPEDNRAYCWFAEYSHGNNWVSEDISFCLRAADLGFSVYVDTTLHIGHYKGGHRTMWPTDIKTGGNTPPRPLIAVIPMKDHVDLTADLVRQLHSQGQCTEIVVVDNGSTPSERAALDDLPVTVIDYPDVGIHHMWNRAADYAILRHGHRSHVAFLNNDLRVGRGFMAAMSRALSSDPELVAVSANYDHRDIVAATLGDPHDPVQEVWDICAGRYDGTGGLAGFAFMAIASLFTAGYRFPEECTWWYGDNDMVAHILSGNGKLGIALRAECEHLDGGGKTAGDWADEAFAEQLAADRRAFEARWERRAAITDFTRIYQQVVNTPSDINEHLPTLYGLAVEMKAQDIIELGTRTGVSTVAWCHAAAETGGRVWAVDVVDRLAFDHPQLTFIVGDDLDPVTMAQLPEQADIVFVDTLHSYEQTWAEINAYKARVRPGGCMVFHDTAVEVHEHLGSDQPPFPTRLAVDEWAIVNDLRVDRWENNNGLTVVWLPEAA